MTPLMMYFWTLSAAGWGVCGYVFASDACYAVSACCLVMSFVWRQRVNAQVEHEESVARLRRRYEALTGKRYDDMGH